MNIGQMFSFTMKSIIISSLFVVAFYFAAITVLFKKNVIDISGKIKYLYFMYVAIGIYFLHLSAVEICHYIKIPKVPSVYMHLLIASALIPQFLYASLLVALKKMILNPQEFRENCNKLIPVNKFFTKSFLKENLKPYLVNLAVLLAIFEFNIIAFYVLMKEKILPVEEFVKLMVH